MQKEPDKHMVASPRYSPVLLKSARTLGFLVVYASSMCLLPVAIALFSTSGSTDEIYKSLSEQARFLHFSLGQSADIIYMSWVLAGLILLTRKRKKLAILFLVASFIWVNILIFLGNTTFTSLKLVPLPDIFAILLLCVYAGDMLAVLFALYMLPTIIDCIRKRKLWSNFALVNLFVAWVPAAWPLLIAIALRSEKKEALPAPVPK